MHPAFERAVPEITSRVSCPVSGGIVGRVRGGIQTFICLTPEPFLASIPAPTRRICEPLAELRRLAVLYAVVLLVPIRAVLQYVLTDGVPQPRAPTRGSRRLRCSSEVVIVLKLLTLEVDGRPDLPFSVANIVALRRFSATTLVCALHIIDETVGPAGPSREMIRAFQRW